MLIGDALGVPYEFHPAATIPASQQIELVPPDGFPRSHVGVPPGTWSDDGAHALCLLDSLLSTGEFHADDFGTRLIRWYDEGYFAVDAHVFDVGVTTAESIRAIRDGKAAAGAGATGPYSMGNGSLMRVLPLVLWHRGPDAELVRIARAQSCVTHAHVRVQVCCALYSLWARHTLYAHPEPWEHALHSLREILRHDHEATNELESGIRPEAEAIAAGSGYVVDTLRGARHALQASTWTDVVRSAIALGGDTDTTACVAGGIAGVKFGADAIPSRWRTSLRGQELYEPLLQRLLDHLQL